MPTRMTARVPTTPETHEKLKEEKEDRGADTFDALIRDLLSEQTSSDTGHKKAH